MKEITRMTFEIYWSYYLSIEKMFTDTFQYVSPSKENSNTYSDEFTKIILLSCAEMDSILKLLCNLNGMQLKEKECNIKNYAKMLEKSKFIKLEAYGPIYASTTNESFLYVTPFENMDSNEKYAGLSWWRDNQLLKHNRMENAKRGNLENALYAIVAYYILITELMNYVEGDSKYLKANNNTSVLIPVA